MKSVFVLSLAIGAHALIIPTMFSDPSPVAVTSTVAFEAPSIRPSKPHNQSVIEQRGHREYLHIEAPPFESWFTGDYVAPTFLAYINMWDKKFKSPAGNKYGAISYAARTLFVFPIPHSYAGRTCKLVFALEHIEPIPLTPETHKHRPYRQYYADGDGRFKFTYFHDLFADENTTYADVHLAFPSEKQNWGEVQVQPGQAREINSHPCKAGETITVRMKRVADSDTTLEFEQDKDGLKIGLYIVPIN